MTTITLIIIGIFSGLVLATMVWLVYQLLPEKVYILDQAIVKKHKTTTQRMSLASLSHIKFHYHAVVGFTGVWEFIDINADSLTIDNQAIGMNELKEALQKALPGFSSTDFEKKFREGDVEDTIDVWSVSTKSRVISFNSDL